MRNVYLALSAACVILAVAGGVFSALAQFQVGISLLAIAIAILPITHHIRSQRERTFIKQSLRDELSSFIKKQNDQLHYATGAQQKLAREIRGSVGEVTKEVSRLNSAISEIPVAEYQLIGRYAHDIVEDSRMIRLIVSELGDNVDSDKP